MQIFSRVRSILEKQGRIHAESASPKLINFHTSTSGGCEMSFTAVHGTVYYLHTSTDLEEWLIVEEIAAQESVVKFQNSLGGIYSARFYQLTSEDSEASEVGGHLKLRIKPGSAMISCPFQQGNNTLEELFPWVPEGSSLTKFDSNLHQIRTILFEQGKWQHPKEVLLPGEGAIFLNNGTIPFETRFSGRVVYAKRDLFIPPGLTIQSSPIPREGSIQEMGFPIIAGDALHLMSPNGKDYTTHTFSAEGWDAEPRPLLPAESFWVEKATAAHWLRDFHLPKNLVGNRNQRLTQGVFLKT